MRAGLAVGSTRGVDGILWGSHDTASPVPTTNTPRAAPLQLICTPWLRPGTRYATVARAVCLGLTRAHTILWPPVWLVVPPCPWHPKQRPRHLSARCLMPSRASDAPHQHPNQGRGSILTGRQTACELGWPLGVLEGSMASYGGAVTRHRQCTPPVHLEQCLSN